MEFIGKYLKSIRIQNKFEIQEISNELKIGLAALEDIENDNFQNSSNHAFQMGHIRAYSKFLNLDDDFIVQCFKHQTLYTSSNMIKKISKPIHNPTLFSIPKSISFVSVLIIGLSFYFLFINPSDLQPNYAMIPDLPENLESEFEETQMNIVINQNNKKIKKDILEKYTLDYMYYSQVNKKNSSSSALASISDQIDKEFSSDTITLKFLGSTWIQLRNSKDLIIISKLMNKGDEYTYNLSQNLNLTSGNAGNIIISINNLIKGKAGKLGEVVDSLVIDNNFNN